MKINLLYLVRLLTILLTTACGNISNSSTLSKATVLPSEAAIASTIGLPVPNGAVQAAFDDLHRGLLIFESLSPDFSHSRESFQLTDSQRLELSESDRIIDIQEKWCLTIAHREHHASTGDISEKTVFLAKRLNTVWIVELIKDAADKDTVDAHWRRCVELDGLPFGDDKPGVPAAEIVDAVFDNHDFYLHSVAESDKQLIHHRSYFAITEAQELSLSSTEIAQGYREKWCVTLNFFVLDQVANDLSPYSIIYLVRGSGELWLALRPVQWAPEENQTAGYDYFWDLCLAQ